MPTMTTLSVKKCVNCHKDVSTGPRMKDKSGRYWCVKCGEADQKKKAALSGELCASCGNRYPTAKLTKMGASKICPGCLKKQDKSTGSKSSGSAGDKGSLIKMLVVAGVLAAIAVAVHFVM